VVVGGDEEVVSDDEYTSEEGEELADVDVESWSSAAHGGSRTDIPSSDRRLSREYVPAFLPPFFHFFTLFLFFSCLGVLELTSDALDSLEEGFRSESDDDDNRNENYRR